ncbi:MAG: hypothetical protein AVDCRST_MAG87-3876, partial [uncultured Thermomicrobiales bacterium]
GGKAPGPAEPGRPSLRASCRSIRLRSGQVLRIGCETSPTGDSAGIDGPHSLNCFAIACWRTWPVHFVAGRQKKADTPL